MEENRFGHDQSNYERPNLPYRCGRGAMWQTPCNHGPDKDGTCGGTQECTPFLNKDRWECRRDKNFGGPCENGPGPDGKCSTQRPPCAPRHTLRSIRKRLVVLAVGIILALVGSSLALDPSAGGIISISDAGPLSKSHAKFTEKTGCSSCHEAHNKGAVGWIKAMFTEADISTRCLNCHSFGGPSFKAHNGNMSSEKVKGVTEDTTPEMQCIMCHREHSGPTVSTMSLASVQCNSCHKNKFDSFEHGHPEFSEKYPYFQRNSIKFDHSTHLKKHFENPKFTEQAPKACVGCHTITLSDREVRPNNYAAICSSCHDSQIKKKELVLIRLPELVQNLIDTDTLAQACNIPKGQVEMEEDFLSVSTEQPALLSAFLLNVPDDDPDTYEKPVQDLILAMAEESSLPLAELIDKQTPTPMSDRLLAGLNPEVLKRAACSWGLNLEYESPIEAKFGGWYADMLEVRYKPSGHEDPVVKSWVEFALAVSSSTEDDERTVRAKSMREQLLATKDGVGGCIKCHAISSDKNMEYHFHLKVDWSYGDGDDQPYVRYKHDNHIEILGTKSSCSNCHIIDSDVDYMATFKEYDPSKGISNFEPIRKKTCMQCHSEKQINLECQKCHTYHFKPSFKKDMLTVKAEVPS